MKCLKDEHDAKRLRIIHVNNRFKRPTSDNWQDIAVSWHVVSNVTMLVDAGVLSCDLIGSTDLLMIRFVSKYPRNPT